MATIAVIAAMPSEMRPFRKRAGLGRRTSGPVADHHVVTATTGIGTALARTHTQHLLDTSTPDHVLVIGIAGAVGTHLRIGDLVVPERVCNDNTGDELTPHPLGDFTPQGTLLTTDELYVDPEHVARLRRQGVVALDMETAAMAAVCEEHDTPWSVFRAISDRADGGLIDQRIAGLTKPDGNPSIPALARLLLTRPWVVGKLSRLARDASAAYATSVATALDLLHTARFDATP